MLEEYNNTFNVDLKLDTLEEIDLKDLPSNCFQCQEDLQTSWLFYQLRVCPHCRLHYSIRPSRRIASLVDSGTFQETDIWVRTFQSKQDKNHQYTKRLKDNIINTGLKEAVVTGICEIGGVKSVLVILDFGFLSGGISVAAGQKIVRAIENAIIKNLPCVTVLSSSGNRIQEGYSSLIQMVRVFTVVQKLKEANLPLISTLANPAFGQVLISVAMQSDVILAENGASIGLNMAESNTSVNTADYFLSAGQIDKITDRETLKYTLSTILHTLRPNTKLRYTADKKKQHSQVNVIETNSKPIANIRSDENTQRPNLDFYISSMFLNFIDISGDRVERDDQSIVCGICSIGGISVSVIGYNQTPLAAGFRKASRVVQMASKFALPIISFVDDSSVYPKIATSNVSSAISNMTDSMLTAEVPIVSVVLNCGGSEYGLPFSIANCLLIMEHAVLVSTNLIADSYISASDEAVEKLLSDQAKANGLVDDIIREPEGGSQNSPLLSAQMLKETLINTLRSFKIVKDPSYAQRRAERYYNGFRIGTPKVRGRFRNDFNAFRKGIKRGTKVLRGNKGSTLKFSK